ncbi:hypothetical protein VTO73DRAFT_13810 [Trametes versicolor]
MDTSIRPCRCEIWCRHRSRPPCATTGGGSGSGSSYSDLCLTYVYCCATVHAATRLTLTISVIVAYTPSLHPLDDPDAQTSGYPLRRPP